MEREASMNRLWSVGLGVWLMAGGLLGCAAGALPPSETTMSILRSYQNQLDSRVASGHLTRAQARELLYTKLGEIRPPLPDLNALSEFRKQVTAQVEAQTLTPEQAEARLAARESEMLARWEEMAAKYARDQRSFEQLKREQERGFQQEQQPLNRPPFR
jgi:hypothetical protein